MAFCNIEAAPSGSQRESLENKSSLAEYSTDNGLLEEIEQSGKAWVIGVYTDQLKTWKRAWKENRSGEGKNQKANVYLRTEADQLLREGSIYQVETLSSISGANPLFKGLNGPMNSDIDRKNGIGYFPCSQELVVGNLTEGTIKHRITHPIFNDLHSVSFNPDTGTMLIVSSGADMIIELDQEGKLLWQWDASSYVDRLGLVDDTTKQRRGNLTNTDDYRKWVIPTPAQTTHINTATWLNKQQIGVTLFHQGLALVIDKESNEANIILKGLVKPHGFQPTDDGRFVVTSTGQGEILILDEKFGLLQSISGFFDNHPPEEISWIHTSYPMGSRIIAVDQTLAELVIVDYINKKLQRIKHSEDWKVSFVARV